MAPRIDLSRFRAVFFEEAAEHLATVEQGLLGLERDGPDPERLNGIFRSVHSIKGASGTFGLTAVASFTHVLESVLDRLREGRLVPTESLTSLLLRARDVLEGLIRAAQEDQPGPAETAEVQDLLQAVLAGPEAPVAPAAPAAAAGEGGRFQVTFLPHPDLFRQGMDPLLLLRDLALLGQISELEPDLSRLPPLDALDPESSYLGWKLTLTTDQAEPAIREVFAFAETGSTLRIEKANGAGERRQQERRAEPDRRSSGSGAEHSTLRVATDKVDQLINLVGELVISQAMVSDVVHGFTPDRLTELAAAVTAMARNTRELQERVMAVRMVPIRTVFSRFPRLVRDLSQQCGKTVELVLTGEDTELDKGMIEKLGDPVLHLVRNAIDHGVEPPEQRTAGGKPAAAALRLAAFHEGGSVVIEVSDDGNGLDVARIRAKAVQQGLIRQDEPLSDEQAHALIFAPGFSTAARVTDVSGRGVGMDVVRQNVDALNGSIEVESRAGRGTTIRIRLPLTLAILDGLSLQVGTQTFIMPLLAIRESFRPAGSDLRRVLDQGEVVLVRGEPLPLVRLHRLFRIAGGVQEPERGLVIVAEHGGRRIGLLVDELLGQQQVVVKSLEQNYRRIEGVMGATILGDGRVALILDVAGLTRSARRGVAPAEPLIPALAGA
jgi:two-component system, chemotaxis family, sensor kinase CheA